MRFLLDMGISPRVAGYLRDNGHDAIHLREEQLQKATDHEVFSKAILENRVLLTQDLDFSDILACTGETRVSVVVFRLIDMLSDAVIRRLGHVLKISALALESGAVISVEESRHRVRLLPIGRYN